MDSEIRAITDAEIPDFRQMIARAFGGTGSGDEHSVQRFRDLLDLDRTYVPFDDGQMVGAGAAYTVDVGLPGGRRAAIGALTMVAVAPTHRRRGLLNRVMRAHFDDCLARGEPVSGLWASESSIYGRYGYGDAAPVFDITIDASAVGVPSAPDDVRIVDKETAAEVFPQVYEAAFHNRPGRLSRTSAWWDHRHLRDPEEWRSGASGQRLAVAYREGRAMGYTTYRQKSKWKDGIAGGKTIVGEVIGIDAPARLSLWSLVCSIDLFPNVTASNVPPDFELQWQVANPRLIRRNLSDGLYVRVLDVPAALEARGYGCSDSIVIDVTDSMEITAGRFLLEATRDGATCAPTSDEPEVSMDVATLSSLYLGQDVALQLARAGRIDGTPEAVRKLSTLLRADAAPCCPEIF